MWCVIDADTQLLSDAVSKLMRHFIADKTGRIGAVAGNVKVGNSRNILTYWQAIEYTTSQNFDRMAYSNINAITVVPGAIGAFRKKVLEEVGGFTTDTLAEDCDLTMCIKRAWLYNRERKLRCGYDRSARNTPPVCKATHTLVFWRNANILETPLFVICNI